MLVAKLRDFGHLGGCFWVSDRNWEAVDVDGRPLRIAMTSQFIVIGGDCTLSKTRFQYFDDLITSAKMSQMSQIIRMRTPLPIQACARTRACIASIPTWFLALSSSHDVANPRLTMKKQRPEEVVLDIICLSRESVRCHWMMWHAVHSCESVGGASATMSRREKSCWIAQRKI